MDLELIKKLNHFNIYAHLGFQFDGIDKFEKYSIAYHNKIKDYWYNFITDIKAESKEEYYVFGYGKLQEIYKQAGDAIQSADNYGGVVVDQNQEYIWQRGNRDLQYKISATSKPVEGLRSELNGGATPMEAISKTFGEDALDLSGCKAEQIAYVMNQGKPVIAVTENKKYVILIGYTETDVTYVEAKNGKSHTVSLEKMDKKANGNYIGS